MRLGKEGNGYVKTIRRDKNLSKGMRKIESVLSF